MEKINRPEAAFGTTLDYLMDVPGFAARAHLIGVPYYQALVAYSFADELRLFWRVVRAAGREKALLLYSSRGRWKPEMMAILAVSFWPRRWRPVIVLYGCMWQPNDGLKGWIERQVIRLADRAVTLYGVYSHAELEIFSQTWGINQAKTRFVPYYYTITRQDMLEEEPPPGEHIFAGGNSFRDYDPLVEAARLMPERKFILATRRLAGRQDLPPNLTAGPVPPDAFIRLMRSAAVVVTPMQCGLRRSTGHQTYLNGMWLKKPTIVNDVLGVRDYVRQAETGWIVDGSPQSYVEALRWILDPAHSDEVRRICENAYQDVCTRFDDESHARNLMAVVDEALGIKR
jgi:glycosyltransferase involved in cell wall biosynthesis